MKDRNTIGDQKRMGAWDRSRCGMKFKKLYTDSWVKLQERYNPNWDAKLT